MFKKEQSHSSNTFAILDELKTASKNLFSEVEFLISIYERLRISLNISLLTHLNSRFSYR